MKKFFKKIIQFYLKILTRIVLWRHKPLIVAIAGTTNKTFTKETILDELGRGPNVRGNPRSFNTEIGLPLAVLFLPSGYASLFKWVDILLTGTSISFFSRKFPKILILEMGVDKQGDMDYLLSMVKPKVVIATNINRAYIENNTSKKDIFEELKKMIISAPKDGLVVLNNDDGWTRKLKKFSNTKTIMFGEKSGSDFLIKNIQKNSFGQKFEILADEKNEKFELNRYGKHHINALVIAKIVKDYLEKMGILR